MSSAQAETSLRKKCRYIQGNKPGEEDPESETSGGQGGILPTQTVLQFFKQ